MRFLLPVLIILLIQFNPSYGQNNKIAFNEIYPLNQYTVKNDFNISSFKKSQGAENLTKIIYVVPTQAVVGTAAGLLFGIAGFGISGASLQDGADHKDAVFPIAMACVGYTLGNAWGAYAIGSAFSLRGKFITSLAGSLLGFLAGYFFVYNSSIVNFPIIFATTPIGAISGYYLFMPSNDDSAFLKFSKKNFSLEFPEVYLSANKTLKPGIAENVELISIKF